MYALMFVDDAYKLKRNVAEYADAINVLSLYLSSERIAELAREAVLLYFELISVFGVRGRTRSPIVRDGVILGGRVAVTECRTFVHPGYLPPPLRDANPGSNSNSSCLYCAHYSLTEGASHKSVHMLSFSAI